MTVHCKCNLKPDNDGLLTDNIEIWADKCDTDIDKIMSQFIGASIKNALDGLNLMGKSLFTPPNKTVE